MRLLRAVFLVLLTLPIAPSLRADDSLSPDIRAEVEAGRRRALVQKLQEEVSLHPDRSMSFYRLGLLSVRQSGDFLRDAGGLPDAEANEQRLIAMARYYIAAGEPTQAMVQASRHVESFPNGKHADEAQYILGLAEVAAGKFKDAESRFDWLSRHGKQPWSGWALYGQGEAALRRGDTSEALRLFKQTTRMNGHPANAPALMMLGNLYDARGKASDAFRYLAMYREAYPDGILPLVEHAVATTDRAEAAAGLVYTIQVGVFGDKANARRQLERFTDLGYTAILKPKLMAGKQYNAVWVGRYKTREAAQSAREKLESKFDDTYRVVVYE